MFKTLNSKVSKVIIIILKYSNETLGSLNHLSLSVKAPVYLQT